VATEREAPDRGAELLKCVASLQTALAECARPALDEQLSGEAQVRTTLG